MENKNYNPQFERLYNYFIEQTGNENFGELNAEQLESLLWKTTKWFYEQGGKDTAAGEALPDSASLDLSQ